MKTKQQLIDAIVTQFQKTELYRDDRIQWVEAAFDDSWHGDLEPQIAIDPDGYRLLLYERGVQIMNKKISPEREHDIIYWILDSCIQTAAYLELLDRHGIEPGKGRLQMTATVQADWSTLIRHAFAATDDIYEEMYRSGKRGELEQM
ncbi:Imm63 family immunity protein [Paenibacillus hunanensis]|uniref:Imm63 family immunity protein n=1 Tax=Paenibacillus hunanensis TaxID=539262 RepID=UPI002A69ADE5|nr:Imm63 family immunity protein [Paenibacillus hunanensis]WPP43278.1 Imm63 family immunity protein [Paenibacillus hunanensis]